MHYRSPTDKWGCFAWRTGLGLDADAIAGIWSLTRHPYLVPSIPRRKSRVIFSHNGARRSQRNNENGKDQMDDKQTFDALLELAKFRRDRLFERSKREDRTSFAVWAILIGAIISLRPRPNDWLLMAMLFVIVAVYAVFVIEVWARNRHNGDEAKYYVYCAERLFAPDAPEPGPRPDYRTHLSFSGRDWRLFFTRDFWWSGMEITFTAALAVLAYFLIGGTCARA